MRIAIIVIGIILLGLGVAWGVGMLTWASVEDHRT